MRTLLVLLVVLSGPLQDAPVELRFQQPMRTNRTVTLVARGVRDGTLRLFTIAGAEAAHSRFVVDASGSARWKLDGYALATGVYLVAAEWEGGRTARLLLIVR